MIRHGVEFLMFGTGAVSNNVCEGRLLRHTGNNDWPDIECYIPASFRDRPRTVKVDGHGMTLNTAYLRPESRGEVTLASSDPMDEPLIDPELLVGPRRSAP